MGKEGRGFVKVLLSELEGALERAAQKAEEAEEPTSAAPGDGEPPGARLSPLECQMLDLKFEYEN